MENLQNHWEYLTTDKVKCSKPLKTKQARNLEAVVGSTLLPDAETAPGPLGRLETCVLSRR